MNELYKEDIKNALKGVGDEIGNFKGKTFFITGASGLIGSFLVDLLSFLNREHDFNIKIVVNARNEKKLDARFADYLGDGNFVKCIGDINESIQYNDKVDYIINCASNTHPLLYSTDPVGTIMTNVVGAASVLDFAVNNGVKKIICLSSVEIYGENIYNVERFRENEMGYIDCNSLRAGYNEAKRCSEALCQAYIEKYGTNVSIVRLPRIYGPTMKMDDTKALSQFIKKAVNGEDIVLKSNGEQYFSYLYVADAASGILGCLIFGEKGEAYNLGNIDSDVKLKDLAKIVAKCVGNKVIFDLPEDGESKGFSRATIARLDYSKAEREIGFTPLYSIVDGVERTIKILKDRYTSFKNK